ncbi:unnamed protein product [Amoebophrya sp. A25]|nr:unnamed protein product [Amoebophrya sp. A25]|eukprot:GSA25T00004807001.1
MMSHLLHRRNLCTRGGPAALLLFLAQGSADTTALRPTFTQFTSEDYNALQELHHNRDDGHEQAQQHQYEQKRVQEQYYNYSRSDSRFRRSISASSTQEACSNSVSNQDQPSLATSISSSSLQLPWESSSCSACPSRGPERNSPQHGSPLPSRPHGGCEHDQHPGATFYPVWTGTPVVVSAPHGSSPGRLPPDGTAGGAMPVLYSCPVPFAVPHVACCAVPVGACCASPGNFVPPNAGFVLFSTSYPCNHFVPSTAPPAGGQEQGPAGAADDLHKKNRSGVTAQQQPLFYNEARAHIAAGRIPSQSYVMKCSDGAIPPPASNGTLRLPVPNDSTRKLPGKESTKDKPYAADSLDTKSGAAPHPQAPHPHPQQRRVGKEKRAPPQAKEAGQSPLQQQEDHRSAHELESLSNLRMSEDEKAKVREHKEGLKWGWRDVVLPVVPNAASRVLGRESWSQLTRDEVAALRRYFTPGRVDVVARLSSDAGYPKSYEDFNKLFDGRWKTVSYAVRRLDQLVDALLISAVPLAMRKEQEQQGAVEFQPYAQFQTKLREQGKKSEKYFFMLDYFRKFVERSKSWTGKYANDPASLQLIQSLNWKNKRGMTRLEYTVNFLDEDIMQELYHNDATRVGHDARPERIS